MFLPHFADELRDLLENFLSQQPGSADALHGFLTPVVAKYCFRHAPSLPLDLREDVLQETLLLLVGSGKGSYDGASNTSTGYVYNVVRTALQSIRRRYGWTVRQRAIRDESIDFDALTDDNHVEEKHHAKIMAQQVLASVEPDFALLLWKVYAEGGKQEVVLAGSGMSRFTFDRRRKAIAQTLSDLGRCA